ncbi:MULTISPECIES: PAS domain-containing protein [Francisella]|uniref:PAS domain S-box protein n=1 Tax=Francisella opportunistica TaxID=2016517 RepID=A0A345JP66_9GAMM|nr:MULTISPECIES: PAS domain-containing protein [Francisella]APC90770.1 hypothetical protein BBG19_0032 [Francisella sp. MA067296]AXH29112.1 PAS domain S-box protein [Francisella opportunistica]AXH30765.1 hypothetical protein CGC44_00160 [Francisella opportunistica]AXH32410.1 hypothetical protein CGC45_00160 [Francisella opportunistica]
MSDKLKDNKIEKLEQEVKILKQIIDSIDANIYWKDNNGTILGINKANIKVLGLKTKSDAIGKKDTELNTGEVHREEIFKNDLKVLESKESHTFDEMYKIGDKNIYFLSRKSCLTDENGNVIGLVGVSMNISEQKKLQHELEKKNKEIKRLSDNQKSSFQQIIDSIDANIYWKDLEGRFLGMNKKNLSLLGPGLTNEDIIGKFSSDFETSKNFNEEIYKNDLYVIKNNKTIVFEEEYISENGEKDTYLATKSCLKNDDGEVIGLVGISVDITKQKKLQHELEKKNNELKEKDKKRSEAAEAIFDVLSKI